MDFIEFVITAWLADHLASTGEEAETLGRLQLEVDELRSEIEDFRDEEEE
jgi:demethoxyubiquinone hydroxylase (CLK1/Coq7/Cat5 family)